MNYFLILGVIVLIILFLALLLNNISKIIQQSERNDIIFSIMGFILAISILIVFIITAVSLQNHYNTNVETLSSIYMLDYNVQSETNDFVLISSDSRLINVRKTTDTKYRKCGSSNPKIKIKEVRLIAPDEWYMMEWKVKSLNNTVLYIAEEIYN